MLEQTAEGVDKRMLVALVCKEYGWTYEEYCSQPQWFLDVIAIKIDTEGRVQKRKEQRQQQLNRNQ